MGSNSGAETSGAENGDLTAVPAHNFCDIFKTWPIYLKTHFQNDNGYVILLAPGSPIVYLSELEAFCPLAIM